MSATISSIGFDELQTYLCTSGIHLRTGPFSYHIKSSLPAVQTGIHLLYGDYPLVTKQAFADFHISMNPVNWLRRWIRPKIHFCMDHQSPFLPMPMKQGLAFFEWGMNWCISNHINSYVKLHAAVLEKEGRAVIMPGSPGAGKSTLSAALALRGWRQVLRSCSHDSRVKHGCPYEASEVRSDFLEACAHYYQYRRQDGHFKKSLLRQFRDKYRHYYDLDHVVCHLPV